MPNTPSSHEAQPCYCGEPNCVGFIGGKTQTDIATMDDLFLDGMLLSKMLLKFVDSAFIDSAWYNRRS